MASSYTKSVVSALAKLENLNANHNATSPRTTASAVVSALVKLEKSKAIHNSKQSINFKRKVVTALVKLENPNVNKNFNPSLAIFSLTKPRPQVFPSHRIAENASRRIYCVRRSL